MSIYYTVSEWKGQDRTGVADAALGCQRMKTSWLFVHVDFKSLRLSAERHTTVALVPGLSQPRPEHLDID